MAPEDRSTRLYVADLRLLMAYTTGIVAVVSVPVALYEWAHLETLAWLDDFMRGILAPVAPLLLFSAMVRSMWHGLARNGLERSGPFHGAASKQRYTTLVVRGRGEGRCLDSATFREEAFLPNREMSIVRKGFGDYCEAATSTQDYGPPAGVWPDTVEDPTCWLFRLLYVYYERKRTAALDRLAQERRINMALALYDMEDAGQERACQTLLLEPPEGTRVTLGPHPTEIIWENIDVGRRVRWGLRTTSVVVSAGVITGSFLILVGVQREVFVASTEVRSMVAASIVSIINAVVPSVIKLLSRFAEKHRTRSTFEATLLIKLLVVRALNHSILLFFSAPSYGYFREFSFRNRIINALAADVIFGTVIKLVDPYRLMVRSIPYLCCVRSVRQRKWWIANEPWHLAERYADIFKVFTLTAMFGSFAPALVYPLLLLNVVCIYATDTLLFRTRWKDRPVIADTANVVARYMFSAILAVTCFVVALVVETENYVVTSIFIAAMGVVVGAMTVHIAVNHGAHSVWRLCCW